MYVRAFQTRLPEASIARGAKRNVMPPGVPGQQRFGSNLRQLLVGFPRACIRERFQREGGGAEVALDQGSSSRWSA